VITKIVNAAAMAWSFDAKAIGAEATAIKLALRHVEANTWPQGLHHCFL